VNVFLVCFSVLLCSFSIIFRFWTVARADFSVPAVLLYFHSYSLCFTGKQITHSFVHSFIVPALIGGRVEMRMYRLVSRMTDGSLQGREESVRGAPHAGRQTTIDAARDAPPSRPTVTERQRVCSDHNKHLHQGQPRQVQAVGNKRPSAPPTLSLTICTERHSQPAHAIYHFCRPMLTTNWLMAGRQR